jgi:hypothetical protein
LLIGFLTAWIALFLMLSSFYEGLVEATIVAGYSGFYHPPFLREEMLPWVMLCVLVSSVCLGHGLRAEEVESEQKAS